MVGLLVIQTAQLFLCTHALAVIPSPLLPTPSPLPQSNLPGDELRLVLGRGHAGKATSDTKHGYEDGVLFVVVRRRA